MIYDVYARLNKNGYIDEVFSTCFKQPKENDVFISRGVGDKYVHVQGLYNLYDENGCHNYKIVDGVITETSEIERQQELKPKPVTMSLEEIVSQNSANIEYISIMTGISL